LGGDSVGHDEKEVLISIYLFVNVFRARNVWNYES